MLLYLDLDNKERFTVAKQNWEQVKELVKSIKRGDGEGTHLDIKNLGIAVIDSVLVDYGNKTAILKSRLILDFRDLEKKPVIKERFEIMMMEDEFWQSQMI